MDSVRGAKHITVQRKKGGLGFSVKGGTEHGIPIVISSIESNCTQANELRLGDEILAVNGQSFQGIAHNEAVQRLRSVGPVVALLIKSNQALEDVFLTGQQQQRQQKEDLDAIDTSSAGSLPQGWSRKIDHKTGRPYYENHYTETTTWKDPRILQPVPLNTFNWSELPLGWERVLDPQGDVYFINHDTCTTHWDSPRGLRQQKQLKELKAFLEQANEKYKRDLEVLRQKRASLLEKTQLLEDLHSQTIPLDSSLAEDRTWDSPTDITDDIMILNEEIEGLDSKVTSAATRLSFLDKVAKNCLYEDIGERDELQSSAQLSRALVSAYEECKGLETKLHKVAAAFETLRKEHNFTDAPIAYMVQLPPLQGQEEVEGNKQWLHLLPDRLTAKTNCEMEVEGAILKDSCHYADKMCKHWTALYRKALSNHGNWEPLLDELAQFDLSPLQDQWVQASLIEKLHKFISFED